MRLSDKEKKELVPELRRIYKFCEENGRKPSALFVKLGTVLNADTVASDDDADAHYHSQTRESIEEMLEAVETNIENEGSGGEVYRDNEKQFIEDARGRFHEKSEWIKPLTGKQVAWLKRLYERS